MPAALHCPSNIAVATELMAWCREYLMVPNPAIRRPIPNQVVCPFVRGAVDSDSLHMAFRPEIDGEDPDAIEAVVAGFIPVFKTLPPADPRRSLRKALLIVFPGIDADRAAVLDDVYAQMKHLYVHAGLMIGQFHPHCDERGIYNSHFRVSRAPYPLMAVRNMSIHDILFLHSDPEWFHAYDARFGHRYAKQGQVGVNERHYVRLYEEARARYSEAPAVPELAGTAAA